MSGDLEFATVETAAAGSHTCAITTTGIAYCWGANGVGQLGNGTQLQSITPLAVSGDIVFRSLTLGGQHTCGIGDAAISYCWGAYGSSHIGTVPTEVVASEGFEIVTAGADHVCAMTRSGVAYCWGRNNRGQLGNGLLEGNMTPLAVAGQY